ncbi:LuxR family transcriptional regulator [Streptomyces sp. NBC_00893]|uniref:helix-turn-helix transcriptional regulator n=1 Tax=Streptomyces sp. NBC_00893 TaxID=2975862 RepID=UPI002259A032|nr:LuxR family transcriptional regulator [Streptomyces sp. NBC_00893]MCX4851558.1 AAA family ATPase [Streptomyces sp. NBC_00893]
MHIDSRTTNERLDPKEWRLIRSTVTAGHQSRRRHRRVITGEGEHALLIERDTQIEQLCQIFSGEASHSLGVITGGVGCGKTELLEDISRRADSVGVRLLSASCSLVEQSLPYAMIDQLFRGLALAGELPLMPAEIRAARDSAEPTPQLLRFFHEALTELTSRGPLMIAVDDVQYADEPSLRCLVHLYCRLPSAQASIVVTHGAQGGTHAPTQLRELLHQPRAARVAVGPLTQEGIGRLAQRRPRDEVADIAALTGGNPLLVRALLQDNPPGGDPSMPLIVGGTFLHTALTCIHRSGPAGLRAAHGIAVLGDHTTVELLSRLTGLERSDTERAIQTLSDSSVLGDHGFLHPDVRTTVLADLLPGDAAELHRRAATLLREEGAPAITLAEHLLAAGSDLAPWATQLLVDASRQALRLDRTTLALRCLRLAEECAVDEAQRLAIKTQLATAVWRIRPEAAAQHLKALAGLARQGHLPPSCSLSLIPGMLWHGMVPEALSAMQTTREALHATPEEAAQAETVAAWIHNTYPGVVHGDKTLGGHVLEQSSPAWRDRGSMANRSFWALASVLRGKDHDEIAATAEQVLQSVRLSDDTLEVLTAALSALLYDGRLELAAKWCARLGSEAAERQASTWRALLNSLHAQIALRRGDLPRAAHLARASLEQMSPDGWGVAIGVPLSTAINAAIGRGDRDEARELVARPVPEQLFDTRFGMHYLSARARHHLAEGHPHAALTDFLSCGERMSTWGMDSAALTAWRLGAAEAWLHMNNRERAGQLVEEHLSAFRACRSGARGTAFRILAATKPPSQQLDLLGRALELLHADGNRLELAYVLADLCRLHRALGDPAKARSFARRAWRVSKDCGAIELCRSLLPPGQQRASLTSVPGRAETETIESLTEAEYRVAVLAAHAHTNREIASKLFITVSTVEQHLTRVYRKLGVRHRQDLPSGLLFEAADRHSA